MNKHSHLKLRNNGTISTKRLQSQAKRRHLETCSARTAGVQSKTQNAWFRQRIKSSAFRLGATGIKIREAMNLGLQSGSFFGYTPDGQHYRVDQIGTSKLIRTKPTVTSYLKRLLCEVVREEKQKEEREFKLLKSVCWFEVGGGKDYLRGSFDIDHYKKVSEARAKYVHQCNCCREKFRPTFGVNIQGLKICNTCIEEIAHFDYLRNERGLSDRQIWDACALAITI